uniref:AbrB/MazE/SpoVT family DNA-binding domain-containing protein n=1 Tax=Burkholderia pseudomallei TaxID=28450 RepID=UPI00155DB0C8|nr:hypothetical protein [Burkholderia pseudomallei]
MSAYPFTSGICGQFDARPADHRLTDNHISPKLSKSSFELMSNGATDMTKDHPHDDELRELVDRITPGNRHPEVDFGRPVGRETWPPYEDFSAPPGE